MKSLFKSFKYLFSVVVISVAFVFGISLNLNYQTAFADSNSIVGLNIDLLSLYDGIYVDDQIYEGEIYLNLDSEKIVNSDNEEIDVVVKSSFQAFNSWNIYNYNEKNFDVLNYGKTLNLSDLINDYFFELSEQEQEGYYQNGIINLCLYSLSSNNAVLNLKNSETSHADYFVEGYEIDGQITLNTSVEYNIAIQAEKNYSLSGARIYNQNQYENDGTFEEIENNSINYTFLTLSDPNLFYIEVEATKIEYLIELQLVDDEMNVSEELIVYEFFDIDYISNAPQVKVDEKIKEGSISLGNIEEKDWKFVEYKLKNKTTNEYETITLDFVFSGDIIDNYLDDGKIILYAIFTPKYTVQVSSGDLALGNFMIEFYQTNTSNYVDITDENIDDNTFFFKMTKFEKIKITALPRADKKFVGFVGANDLEIYDNICLVSNISEDYSIICNFANNSYIIVLSAVDSLSDDFRSMGESIEGYAQYTSVFVNDVKSLDICKNDVITGISTETDNTERQHRFVKFQIYSFKNSIGWSDFVVNANSGVRIDDSFISNYIDAQNNCYIRACYVKHYRVSVNIASICTDSGYFNLRIDDVEKNETIFNAIRLTEYEGYADIGQRVVVTALPYAGYEFSQFSMPNDNKVNPNIMSKIVRYQELDFDIIFDKIEVKVFIEIDSEDVTVSSVDKADVNVGDKLSFTYKADLGRKVRNIKINNVSVEKLKNVEVTDNTIIVEITSDFLASLNSDKKISLYIDANLDVGYASLVIIIPVIVFVLLIGNVVLLCYFLKEKKKYNKIKGRDIK